MNETSKKNTPCSPAFGASGPMQCSVVYSGIGVACTDTVTMPTLFVLFVLFVLLSVVLVRIEKRLKNS
jgi:hypothetical protein